MDNNQKREIKMAVNHLVISFKTANGKVQAVRDISFDLGAGETLAIVGESGSGKSVTTKAMLGILAGNAVKEGGEIIYDGMDLMKISEEEFCKIRGDKIAMIFQDPLSSLNPIMRVGKQMTEAMIINGKINRRASRKAFNGTLALLNKCMDAASAGDESAPQTNKQLCADFNKFECKHLELEIAYNDAFDSATEALADIDDALFLIEKHADGTGLAREIKDIIRLSGKTYNEYVVHARRAELEEEIAKLRELSKVKFTDKITNFVKPLFSRNFKLIDRTDYDAVAQSLGKVKEILSEAVLFDRPDFFTMGYYVTFAQEPLPDLPVKQLNAFLQEYADSKSEFTQTAEKGVRYSARISVENKRAAIKIIDECLPTFDGEFTKSEAYAAAKKMVVAVNNAIDRLQTAKDNVAYTFGSSMKAAVDLYYNGIKSNAKEEKRFERQTASYDKKIAKGKKLDWKVADKKLFDLQAVKQDIINLATRVKSRFERDISQADGEDFAARTSQLIDFLKDKASGVAHKITRGMAKTRALKLMEEVGIPEARKRFRQYPFEFSGGMRQRIVIAIALSADPDVLICDEPTTALDVTIQSQILELINKVKRERNLSVIFITHDLGVVANMADRVAVMYAGKIVEIGTALDVFHEPAHPYTWALLSSMPDLDTKDKLEAIPGTPPNMIYPPKGDAFADRNKYAMQIDFEAQPPMFKISDTHYAATWLLHPSAPKISPPKPVLDRIARMKAQTAGATQNAAQPSATEVQNDDGAADKENTDGATAEKVEKVEKEPAAKPAKRKPAKSAKSVKADDGDKAQQKPPKSAKPAASKPAAKKAEASKTTAKKSESGKTSAKKPAAKKEKVTEKDGNGGTGNGK